jgi:formiminoglutamase
MQVRRIIKTDFFGIEIDLDAIPNIASSMTLSGFSVEELRQFISFGRTKMHLTYIYCEGT